MQPALLAPQGCRGRARREQRVRRVRLVPSVHLALLVPLDLLARLAQLAQSATLALLAILEPQGRRETEVYLAGLATLGSRVLQVREVPVEILVPPESQASPDLRVILEWQA